MTNITNIKSEPEELYSFSLFLRDSETQQVYVIRLGTLHSKALTLCEDLDTT